MKTTGLTSAKSMVETLAHAHHVNGDADGYSALAKTITQLSGDDIELDSVERTIVSLKKLGVLSKLEALQLELRYLREQAERPAGA